MMNAETLMDAETLKATPPSERKTTMRRLFTVATWNAGPEFGPRWYPLALVVTALPCAWVGGSLRVAQLRKERGNA